MDDAAGAGAARDRKDESSEVNVLDRLLQIQDHDSAADRLRHRLATLPERAQLVALEEGLSDLSRRLEEIDERHAAAAADQRRREDDLAALESRLGDADRRLYSGAVSAPRELQALQADIASMRRHQGELEERVLEAMAVREPLELELAKLRQARDQHDQEAGRLQAAIAEASVELEVELETQMEARAAIAAGMPDEVMERYEGLRARLDGVGAARLLHGMCSGCHLALPATELDRLRRQPPEAVVLCDQCGRILVRVASPPGIPTPPGGAPARPPGAPPGVLA